MNLRKALDKANKNRQENVQKATADPSEFKSKTKDTGAGDSTGWLSPVYSSSRNINIDKITAIENRCVSLSQNAPEIDFYKVIRTQILQKTQENDRNLVMITSVNPGEGKTVTAINLAVTFAKEFNNTSLLVDCDLKQQKIYHYLGLPGKKGLADYLIKGTPMDELIIWPGIEKLTLISGGAAVKDSAELLGSPKMKSIVKEMKNRYDNRYIFFDVPPVLNVADSIAFAPLVDSILMVVQAGRTSVNDIKKALAFIPEEKFLGFVFNRSRLANKAAAYN